MFIFFLRIKTEDARKDLKILKLVQQPAQVTDLVLSLLRPGESRDRSRETSLSSCSSAF
jgi:hypothetical protein